ncbi:hypothetical protein J6590_003460 [Homalodisca vitripennis]|nr:hypothetical protein J6590_003460 [Homalodisca vitripennis]
MAASSTASSLRLVVWMLAVHLPTLNLLTRRTAWSGGAWRGESWVCHCFYVSWYESLTCSPAELRSLAQRGKAMAASVIASSSRNVDANNPPPYPLLARTAEPGQTLIKNKYCANASGKC